MLTLEEKIGQMLMVGFDGLEAPPHILEWLARGQVGGIILFSRNIGTPQQLAELTQTLHKTAKFPLLIAIDQEGGTVSRMRNGFTESPGAMALGAAGDAELAEAMSTVLGEEMRAVGINWNFAPVVDILHDARNAVIGTRSLGDDPHKVAELGVAQTRGFQRAGVATTAKHFPGHGNTNVDTHEGLAVIRGPLDFLWESDLIPFKAAVEGGAAGIMISHVVFDSLDPVYPATLSPVIIRKLLREEMNYDGVACTDCLEMGAITDNFGRGEAATLAAIAGADIILISHTRDYQEEGYNAMLDAARSGRLPLETVDAAVRRVQGLKQRFAITTPPALDRLLRPEHLAIAQDAARSSVTAVRTGGAFPLRPQAGKVALVEFASYRDSVAVDAGRVTDFGGTVLKRLPEVEMVSLTSVDTDPAALDRAYQLTASADVLVLVTRNAHAIPEQAAVARDLIARAKRVVVVCLRDPFDAILFPSVDTILCTYGDSQPSLDAAAAALAGDFIPTGKLPVRLEREEINHA